MFSAGFILLQLGYACLLGVAFMRNALWRRSFLLAAAMLFAIRAMRSPIDPITLGWMAIIILACAALIGRPFIRNAAVHFTPEDLVLRSAIFEALPAHEARHLMDQGWWLNGAPGETLTRQDQPVETLVFMQSGSAQVLVGGRPVGSCGAGDLIGEATALTGAPATATVVLDAPARLWCIKSATLRDYISANPDVGSSLERSFRIALRAKLMATNMAIAAHRVTG
ncbi:cyclic nucleotide-binding domain-containing protein [Sphingomonas sp. 28-63-12]|uniref:cyclic nucleotide-binding domain-containing protein n=1 Tax=Sphingomonas sp. 28-63-12 TaxID=1970434 RepID=UPI000BC628A1|nr:MAG: hypothetical protein B7Y47_07700 [Sphingomonas sp. 28-63-12]